MKFHSFLLAAAPIVSVGLYQEDVAVVTRSVTPENGAATVRLDEARPFSGSLWYSASAPIRIREYEGERAVSVSFRAPAYLRNVIEAAKAENGHLVTIGASERTLSLQIDWQVFTVKGRMKGDVRTRFELDSGSFIEVDDELIVSIDGLDSKDLKFNSSGLYSFWELTGATTPFTLEYLTSGANWTPAYRLMLDGEKATLFMSGKLVNHLADWQDAEVSIISGKCNFDRENDDSFEYRKARGYRYLSTKKRSYAPMMECAAAAAEDCANGYESMADNGAGDDIHCRSLGKLSLKSGETLTVPLGAEKVAVKRLVEWTATGLWDAVKFKNPFKFPMTAAKMEVVEENRILGMPKTEWTNSGDETFVKIAEASSVKGKFEEEREGKGHSKLSSFGDETMKVNGKTYAKEKLTGRFKVTNFRAEAASMSVKRVFAGELGTISLEPTKTKEIPPHDFGINLEHELTWEFDLKPGETREFTVEYSRWIRF